MRMSQRINRRYLNLLGLVLLMLLTLTGNAAAEDTPYFTTTPALSPDGQKVVFSFEEDLWQVSASGGTAFRLTGMQGFERNPRFSPDGKWLAFSGSQDGNLNVYVMPVKGGAITRLTFHGSWDLVDSWSWDSKYIYFTSNRENSFSSYRVNREGGTPERLFPHFFNTVHGVIEHPVSGAYYFTDSWESMNAASRKRYKGDFNPDIKSYHPATKDFTLHTSYRGKDLWPTIDGKGKVYFASDRFNGEYNLYKLEKGEKVRLTGFKRAIKYPQAGANGEKIVFEKDYQIFVYDTLKKTSQKLAIRLFRNNLLKKDQEFAVTGKITNFAASPDNKKIAFVSRGELMVSNIGGTVVRRLSIPAGERVREILWLKDNRTLLYTRTHGGWFNLFSRRADKKNSEKQLTSEPVNIRYLSLNSDATQVVFNSGARHVKILDIPSSQLKTVAEDEIWGIFNSAPCFSPDDQYVAYVAHRNMEKDIFLYHLETKKTVNLTATGVSEMEPAWSGDGKYLFFTSNRYSPLYTTGYGSIKIYRLPLEKYDSPYRAPQWDAMFEADKEQETDSSKGGKKSGNKNGKKDKKQGETPKKPRVSIDFTEMALRWEQVTPRAGSQYQGRVFTEEDKKSGQTIYHVLYVSNHDGDGRHIWKTTLHPFKKPETKKIKGAKTGRMNLSKGGKQYYLLVNGAIGKLDLKANSFTPINIAHKFRKNLESEFRQMFFEVWASLKENFYDEKFHGVDWEAMRRYYLQFFPHIHSRANLRVLLRDLLGELNASHLGFSSNGKEEKTFHKTVSIETGLLFDPASPYRVSGLITGSPADKKDIGIRPGDLLTAVNHRAIDPALNRDSYFSAPSLPKELPLTFRRGEKSFHVNIHPATNREIRRLRYDEWIRGNQKRVDTKGKSRIAYIHMKNMGSNSLRQFLIEMTSENYRREALILDLRYNTGGNVHDAVLNFLSQRPYSHWKYREGEMVSQPFFTPGARPMTLLINEQSLSDAEMTAAGFKALKLGKVIGTETYRWLIFTSDDRLVDGSSYRIPSWGCYTIDKKNIETDGVKPDIYIRNTFTDRLQNKDPQLDAAISHLLEKLDKR